MLEVRVDRFSRCPECLKLSVSNFTVTSGFPGIPEALPIIAVISNRYQ